MYVGKGKYVTDDPAKYPGREANAAAGGWAGGEKARSLFRESSCTAPTPALFAHARPHAHGLPSQGLWAFREEARGVVAPKEVWTKGPNAPRKVLPRELDVDLTKDFGRLAGGFPGGEVGLKSFNSTGKVAKNAQPPTVGLGAYFAVAAAGAYAACVYATGDLNPGDWEFTTADGTPGSEVPGGKRATISLPAVSLPAIDSAVARTVAPPALLAGGVVAAALALQVGLRKLAEKAQRTATLALFAAAVGAAAGKILGLL